MNTCDKCKNWRREDLQDTCPEYKDQGYCKLFGDSYADIEHNDRCYAEGDGPAGILAMAKFGCIHWEQK